MKITEVLSEVLSEPLSSLFLSYFIFTQAKNKYNFKKIKNLITTYVPMLIPNLHRILSFGISIGKYSSNYLNIYIFFSLGKYKIS